MTTSPTDGTDLARMQQIAASGTESQRITLARDPQTPDEIIETLTGDRSMLVRDFALTEAKRRGLTGGVPTANTPASAGRPATDRPVMEAAEQALSSARLLSTANMIVLVLSLLGALILVLMGFQSSCIDGGSYCADYEKQSNSSLIVMGAVIAISAFWIFAIANAIAARVGLAGAQARQGN